VIEEVNFVPFEVSPLPAGPWLVFAPHADDETFGMGGSLLKASRQGIEAHLIVVTDGALGGEREGLVAIRTTEVQRAVEFLGIASLQCWDEADRGLQCSRATITKASNAILQLRPAAVFFPAAYEPHPDHRATTQIVWQAMGKLLRQARQGFNPPIPLSYEIGVQSPINTLVDVTDVMPQKLQAIAIYNSQNEENNYPQLIAALNRARTFSLPEEVEYAEAFFRYTEAAATETLRSHNDRYYERYWQ